MGFQYLQLCWAVGILVVTLLVFGTSIPSVFLKIISVFLLPQLVLKLNKESFVKL